MAFQDASSGVTTDNPLGFPVSAPPPPLAAPKVGGAPTVSSTPNPGQGIALDAAGKLPASVLTRTTRGVSTVSWPGGSSLSSPTTVTHALGSTPTGVTATMITIVGGVGVICAIQVPTLTATTFDMYAQTLDGSAPAAASAITVFWTASL